DFLDSAHTPAEPLVLAGDFNVAPEPDDVFDPEALLGTTCYHPDEHRGLAALAAWGLQDAFRLADKRPGQYSWWDYRGGAWNKDHGMRIDHIWLTPPLSERLAGCWIEREERGRDRASDHAPVLAALK
ncbi:MAG: exodeoxyribonuclease III, partial [Deltaproteobacteria bacterium]|nr:exodeoxyribonuclease III [Deltaproteobacteria bacterium]